MWTATRSIPAWVLVLGVACGGGETAADGAEASDGGASDDIAMETSGPGDDTSTGVHDSTGDDVSTGADESTGNPDDPRLAVTADFTAGTLSLLDVEAIAAGATDRDAVLVDEIDLSSYPPGPLEVELAPDGRTALVAVSPGFFGGVVGGLAGIGPVPDGGALLVVDLPSRAVVAELTPAHVAMGIAIAPDGATAFTANYGTSESPGNTMSVIDLSVPVVVDDVALGGRPEQVALSSDGTLGLVNVIDIGAFVAFAVDDPATLSAPVIVGGDPSDVAFVAGTSLAVVSSSLSPATYAVIDLADPMAPVLLETVPRPGGVPYGVTAITGTTDVLVTMTDFSLIRILRVAAAEMPSQVAWSTTVDPAVGFPLGIAVDTPTNVAIAGAPGADVLVVLALDGTDLRTIAWPQPGPSYVAIQAAR